MIASSTGLAAMVVDDGEIHPLYDMTAHLDALFSVPLYRYPENRVMERWRSSASGCSRSVRPSWRRRTMRPGRSCRRGSRPSGGGDGGGDPHGPMPPGRRAELARVGATARKLVRTSFARIAPPPRSSERGARRGESGGGREIGRPAGRARSSRRGGE